VAILCIYNYTSRIRLYIVYPGTNGKIEIYRLYHLAYELARIGCVLYAVYSLRIVALTSIEILSLLANADIIYRRDSESDLY